MRLQEPSFLGHRQAQADPPRHPHQEIADLLALALLRLQLRTSAAPTPLHSPAPLVGLHFLPEQSVNANPSRLEGVDA
ncbi:hypothetical protein [Eleftheria terrae]|uniref:hypothetical protein n=1 Tax=Eleftheria terrae TaxID=1597781 RepID=UPI00263B0981|nr:hypothetical protein [Eleftheria terrae]WKB50809.1 hypothetical protein N7L95_13390 [Eleftheria terrae]WKB50888.1 hypothetical protein N7L95_13815 [Eleftheria terrae]